MESPSKDEQGAIEIKITGLRSGEKLYEELLVDANALETEHPKIMRAREQYLSKDTLEKGLSEIKEMLNKDDLISFKKSLKKLVSGYQPSELGEYD